jgi:hypothetical protein
MQGFPDFDIGLKYHGEHFFFFAIKDIHYCAEHNVSIILSVCVRVHACVYACKCMHENYAVANRLKKSGWLDTALVICGS